MSDLLGLLIECYNKNDFLPLRPYLSDDCKYTSQWVFDEMVGGNKICDYLIMLDKMQHTRYDCIRQDPRFISVFEKLNLYAK